MNIYSTLAADIIETPDRIHQIITRQNHTRLPGQIQQDFKLLGTQINTLSTQRNFITFRVDFQLSQDNGRSGYRRFRGLPRQAPISGAEPR